MSRADAADPGRIVGLDALRGVAIAAVFLYHATLELNRGLPSDDPSTPGWLGAIVSHPLAYFVPQHLGVFGVQLFFVLSGFCIHLAVLRWDARHPGAPARARWLGYLGRRAARIYPLYTLVLVALLALEALGPGASGGAAAGVERPSALATAAVHLGMLQTLVPDHVNRVNPSFWSLAVEVQWYALYPLVHLALRRFGALRALVPALLLCLLWRALVPELTRHPALTQLPLRWGFEWLLGVLVAALAADPTSPPSRWLRAHAGRLALGLGVVALAALLPTRAPLLYATLPPLAFAALVARVALGPPSSRPAPASWAALGRVSYALYLVHQPAFAAVAAALVAWGVGPDRPLVFLAATLVVAATTVPLAYVLERAADPLRVRVTRASR